MWLWPAGGGFFVNEHMGEARLLWIYGPGREEQN